MQLRHAIKTLLYGTLICLITPPSVVLILSVLYGFGLMLGLVMFGTCNWAMPTAGAAMMLANVWGAVDYYTAVFEHSHAPRPVEQLETFAARMLIGLGMVLGILAFLCTPFAIAYNATHEVTPKKKKKKDE